MTNISRTELCQWLRDNSSGVYRHAADEIETLVQFSNRYFVQAMANGEEVRRLREENERLRKDAERYRWLIDQHWIQSEVDWRLIPTHQESTIEQLSKAIDAARGAK